jgi:O-antigen ligase
MSGRSAEIQTDSTISRIILWQAGTNIALNNPLLGIGAENYITESRQYQSKVDSDLIAYEKRGFWGYRTLGNEPPHNDFINVWSGYGTAGALNFNYHFGFNNAKFYKCIPYFRKPFYQRSSHRSGSAFDNLGY